MQSIDDKQVPYEVTLLAVQDMCAHGVPVTFDVIEHGDHWAPMRAEPARRLIVPWVQRRLSGDVQSNCAALPPPAQLTMYTVVAGDTLSGIADRFNVAGGWQQVYQLNDDLIANANLIFPDWHLFIS